VQGEVAQQVTGTAGEVDHRTSGGRMRGGQGKRGQPARVAPAVQEVGADPAEPQQLDGNPQSRRTQRRTQLRVRRGRCVPPVVGVGEQHHRRGLRVAGVERGDGPLAHVVAPGPQPRDALDHGPAALAVVQRSTVRGDGGVGVQRRPGRAVPRHGRRRRGVQW
jgi:hypothetical protein